MPRVSIAHGGGLRIAAAGPTPGTARATLLDILGDLVHPSDEAVPTSAFLEVMGALGHSEHAIRQAIARCSNAGWIVGTKSGRTTSWGLTRSGTMLVEEGITGVERLSDPRSDWDGRWRIMIITIPNEHRAARDGVYRALRWDGFGNPLPSVWVSPHPGRHRRVSAVLADLGLDQSTLSVVGELDGLGPSPTEIVQLGWNLSELDDLYAELVRRFAAEQPATDEEHLISLLRLDEQLQELLVTDPQIPGVLTPEWSGRDAAAKLLALRRRWRPVAVRHWQTVLSRNT